MDLQSLLPIFDLLGAFFFSLSGALVAEKRQMDIFGMLVFALITALSGVALRDILLGISPVSFLLDIRYILITILATVLVFAFRTEVYRFGKLIKIFDAMGLGIFFSSGMTVGLLQHTGFISSILLGVIMAVFGGIIRDILGNEIPLIFRKELYASTCVIGGLLYFVLYLFPIDREYIVIIVAGSVTCLRLLVIQKNWSLPPA